MNGPALQGARGPLEQVHRLTLFWSLFKGSALGLVLGGFGIIVLTLAVPRHVGTAPPEMPLTEGPVTADTLAPEVPETEIEIAGADDVPTTTAVPDAPTQSNDSITVLADTDPLALPEVTLQAPTPDAPVEIADLPSDTTPDSPVLPNPQSLAPQTPVSELDVVVSTEPAATPTPIVIDDTSADVSSQQVVIVEDIETPSVVETSPIPDEVAVAPSVPTVTVEETTSPTLPVTTEVATLDAPALDQGEAAAQSPQDTNSIDAPTEISTAEVEEGTPAEVIIATEVDANQPEPTAPELVLAEVTTPSPSQANELATPDTIDTALIEDEAVDIALAQIEDVEVLATTDPLPATSDLAEVDLGEDALVQPDVPAVVETTPTIAELGETTQPTVPTTAQDGDTATAPSEIVIPDDTVIAALPADVTAPAVPAPIQSAQVTPVTANPPAVRSIFDRATTDVSLPQGAGGVRVNRIGTAAPVEEPSIEDTSAEPEVTSGALERFAAPFTPTEGMPLLSVALYDDGLANAPDLLAESGLPITVILDAAKPNVAETMKLYRDAGFEVAMTVTLPQGATISDAAIALEAAKANVSQAVAYIDVAGVAASSRDFAAQFSVAIAEDGLGLVLPDSGLNPGLAEAAALDVTASLIDRNLSDVQQDPRVLGRFLEQAAFQSRQNGQIVLLGRLNADMLTALQNFAQSPRGTQVSLAPVSAALLSE